MDIFANMDITVDKIPHSVRRPWIISALNLRFNDGLPYREIAEQLNTSSSATHKMFKRFKLLGIDWPLSPDYTLERLEEELYAFNLETNLPVKKRRPDWPIEFKIRMAELSMQPGACVAQLARENGVNDNLVFNWRNLHRQGLLEPGSRAELLPITVESFPVPVKQNVTLTDPPPVMSCKLSLPNGSLSLTGPLTSELLRTLVCELKGGTG